MTPALGGREEQNKTGRTANLPVLERLFKECDLQVFARERLTSCLLRKLE